MSTARKSALGRHPSVGAEEAKQSLMQEESFNQPQLRGGCCFNCREMYGYQAPSQEQLRAFLFSSSERFSTFIQKEDIRREEERKTNASLRNN
jgi:hypothetical protein